MPLLRPSEKAATSAPVALGMIDVRRRALTGTEYHHVFFLHHNWQLKLSHYFICSEMYKGIKLQKEIFDSTCWFVNSLHHANLDPHLSQVLNPEGNFTRAASKDQDPWRSPKSCITKRKMAPPSMKQLPKMFLLAFLPVSWFRNKQACPSGTVR